MENLNPMKPSENEMADFFEVEELESRLEMCWAACVDGCCSGCNGACGNNVACGDAVCGNDGVCVPVNDVCGGGGGGGGGDIPVQLY